MLRQRGSLWKGREWVRSPSDLSHHEPTPSLNASGCAEVLYKTTFDDARDVAVWSAEDEDTTGMYDIHGCFWQMHVHNLGEGKR